MDADSLRVVTFNVRTSNGRDGRNRWWFRRRYCVASIRELGADVVGLQEVRPDQLRYLRRAFTDATFAGRGRDANGRGEHVSVLAAPGWTLESQRTRWLSPTPDEPGSRGWGAALPRTVTFARLRRGDARVGVANTHLDDKRDETRTRQAEQLADWLRSELSAEPDRAWVVTGDLNTDPDTEPLRTLATAGFTDALAGTAGGTEHGFTGRVDRRRIDFVLPGPGLAVAATGVAYERPDGRLPSDHWPVWADLTMRTDGSATA